MPRIALLLSLLVTATIAHAGDYCITGVKGTITSAYTFRVHQTSTSERVLSLLDANHNTLFAHPVTNRFTQFNSTGYGVCSLTTEGTDEATGSRYRIELKVSPHNAKACSSFQIPTAIEYITLKINPKGTTLGDDLTAYALTPVSCP